MYLWGFWGSWPVLCSAYLKRPETCNKEAVPALVGFLEEKNIWEKTSENYYMV